MLRQLTAREFLGWSAYAELEPFGEERGDIRAALIATVLANINRDPKRRPQAFRLEDFMLKFDSEVARKRPQTWQEKLAIVRAIAVAYGESTKKKTRKKKAA